MKAFRVSDSFTLTQCFNCAAPLGKDQQGTTVLTANPNDLKRLALVGDIPANVATCSSCSAKHYEESAFQAFSQKMRDAIHWEKSNEKL